MKKVLITGASKGIGYELALKFAIENHALFLIARNQKKLDKLKDKIKKINPELPCHVMSFDLIDLDDIVSLVSNIKNKFGSLDVVIHNAGLLINKDFVKIKKTDLINSFMINYFSPFLITQKLIPILKYDIQCMSIGFLADQQTPMIWRGPMVTSAIKTFTQKVNWKDLDFIIVDMPPGTGDTQLTFSQEIKMDGAIIVSTPQEVALLDVKRGIKMFDKLGVKILGLVDNMSFFVGDDGKKYKIFGEGGVKKTAEEFQKDFLGEVPINPEVGKMGDEGKPIVEANPEHEISKIYINFAEKIKSTYL